MAARSKYLQVALQAASEAEAVINSYVSKNKSVSLKVDQSPVTLADTEAEQVIKEVIFASFPDHQIFGEESGMSTSTSPYMWVIDPIDGTKNYMRNIPLFATQIALLHEEKVIVGVSNAPKMNELMYAEQGEGSFLNHERVSVSSTAKVSDAYLSYGGIGYFQQKNLMDSLLSIECDTLAHRGIGDFWSYHLLAQGKIDIMLEAQTKLWDIAALSLIVTEAGGTVHSLSGNSIGADTDSIIATNGVLQAEVERYFAEK